MIFTRAQIYGFGKWVDKKITFNQGNLNVIYGENESGKSTLQAFISYMLFGLSAKELKRYQPNESSKLGGTLSFLNTENELITIERTAEKNNLYIKDKVLSDEREISKQMNGLTNQIFKSIYSFSAVDLFNIREMNEQTFGNILFNVGLAGATNIEVAEKNIEREISKVFKKTGRIPLLNKQLTKLEELNLIEEKLNAKEHLYKDKHGLVVELTAKAERLNEDLHTMRNKLSERSKELHLLPVVKEFKATEQQLLDLPKNIDFPEKGIERLEVIKEKLMPLLSNQKILNENMTKHMEKIVEEKRFIIKENLYKKVKKVISQRAEYEKNTFKLEKMNEEKLGLENEVTNQLLDLDVDLNRTEFIEYTFPYYLEKTWKNLGHEAEELMRLKNEIIQSKAQIESQLIEIKKEENYYEERSLQLEKVDELKTKLIYNEQSSNQTNYKREHEANKTRQNSQVNKIYFSGVALGILMFLAYFSIQQSWLIYSSLFLIVSLSGIYYFIKQADKKTTNLINTLTSVNEHELSPEEVRKYKKLLEKHEASLIHIQSLKSEKNKQGRLLLQIGEKEKICTQRQDVLELKLNDERTTYNFLTSIEPVYWNELLTVLKQMKRKEEIINELTHDIAVVEKKLNAFELELKEVLTLLGLTSYVQLIERLNKHEESFRRVNEYKELIEKLEVELNDLNIEINLYASEKYDLLDHANVDTEELFYKAHYEYEQLTTLNEKLMQYDRQLKTSFTKSELENILSKTLDAFQLEEEIAQYKEDIMRVSSDIEEVRTSIATLNVEINQMESSEEYSSILHKITLEKEKMKSYSFEWAALKLAAESLEETKKTYHKKYMKDVISKATEYFKIITNKKYINIFPPINDSLFTVETHNYTRFKINQLSQGTIDQLYVSIRLAISSVMSEKHAVPFIIDDAFVHFDHKREQAMLNLLTKICEDQQILFFTCKKHLITMTDADVHYLTKVSDVLN